MTTVSRLRHTLSRYRTPYLLLLPSVVYLFGFTIYPILNVFYLSLTDLHLVKSLVPKFIGLKNFYDLIWNDADFRRIVVNTFIWTFGSTSWFRRSSASPPR